MIIRRIWGLCTKSPRASISSTEKVLYFGSDDIAAPSLQSLHGVFPSLEVVTHYTPPNIKQDNKVADYCTKHNLKCHSPIHKTTKEERAQQWDAFNEYLSNLKPCLGVILSYGYMIPTATIQKFKEGMIVVHPSLLPKYRGGAPIFHTILNGDKESGVSYINISPDRFDQGNILYQVRTTLPQHKPYKEIERHMGVLASEHINHVVSNLESLRPGKPQSKQGASSAPIIRDTKLQLDMEAEKVYNMSRAIKQARVRYSGAKSEIIVKLTPETFEGEGEIGQLLIVPKKKVFVRCKDKYVRLETYKQPSRGQLPAWSFAEKYLKGIEPNQRSQHRFY